jgi:small subunit ribosomal protein S6e
MKINIAYPAHGTQRVYDIEDSKKLAVLMDKRISAEIEGDSLSDQFKGYIFRITGGIDKQGFMMKQGVLSNSRVSLLLKAGSPGLKKRSSLRKGTRMRKSVRGCIVGSDLSVVNLTIVKKGDEELEAVTDKQNPRRLGPKRASKIRKLWDLSKKDDVRKFVIRRKLPDKDGKKEGRTKAPKIQRLITSVRSQRWRKKRAAIRKRKEASWAAKEQWAHLQKLRGDKAKMRKKARLSRQKMDLARKSKL